MKSKRRQSGNKNKWAVIIYLAGDNTLREEMVWALKEMKQAGANSRKSNSPSELDVRKDIRIVAQLDTFPLGRPEQRYEITIGDKDGQLHSDVVGEEDTANTTYPQVLKDFILWGMNEYRAEHYMVVLSGHGSGTEGDFLSKDNPLDALSIPALEWVFSEVVKAGKKKFGRDFKIDIVGMDSCLMSMIEVGFELRHYVRYMVGAEGFEPDTGWPYERILAELYHDPPVSPKEFAGKIVEKYTRYYKDFEVAGMSVDQSACDLSKLELLAETINHLAIGLKTKLEAQDLIVKNAVLLAHWEAQSYKDDQYVDLYDFCELLPQKLADLGYASSDIKEQCDKVKKYVRDGSERVVLKSCYSGNAVQYSHGLSIYFPWADVSEDYSIQLDFGRCTRWDEFLRAYVQSTRRVPRQAGTTGDLKEAFPRLRSIPSDVRNSVFGSKNAVFGSKVLGNESGSMKNPPDYYRDCDCGDEADGSGDEILPKEFDRPVAKMATARKRGER
jgi:hypothetical protein